MNALDVLCAQLTRDLFAIAKFLLLRGSGETRRSKTTSNLAPRFSEGNDTR